MAHTVSHDWRIADQLNTAREWARIAAFQASEGNSELARIAATTAARAAFCAVWTADRLIYPH